MEDLFFIGIAYVFISIPALIIGILEKLEV